MSCLFKVKPKVVINFIFRKFFVFFKRECFILLCRPVLSRKFGGFGPGHKKSPGNFSVKSRDCIPLLSLLFLLSCACDGYFSMFGFCNP